MGQNELILIANLIALFPLITAALLDIIVQLGGGFCSMDLPNVSVDVSSNRDITVSKKLLGVLVRYAASNRIVA